MHGEAPDRASTLISYAVPAFAYLRLTTDTTVKAVIFEDVAALIGLVLAAAGVGLRQLTGQSAWDGLASMAVGVLLVVAAASLARTNLSLLIGQAARPQLQAGPARRSRIAARRGVRAGLRRLGDRSRRSSHRREGALRRRLLGCRHRARGRRSRAPPAGPISRRALRVPRSHALGQRPAIGRVSHRAAQTCGAGSHVVAAGAYLRYRLAGCVRHSTATTRRCWLPPQVVVGVGIR